MSGGGMLPAVACAGRMPSPNVAPDQRLDWTSVQKHYQDKNEETHIVELEQRQGQRLGPL